MHHRSSKETLNQRADSNCFMKKEFIREKRGKQNEKAQKENKQLQMRKQNKACLKRSEQAEL
jgi:hypothetical protein